MKKNVLVLAVLGLLSLFCCFGCGTEVTYLDELVVGVGKDTVDPNGGMWESRGLIFETLVTLDENGEQQPLLAKSWEIAPDGKSYTFHLQENIKFHDGTIFNAQAIKENVTKLKNVWGKYPIDKVEIIDEYTVRFCLKEQYPLFMWHIAQVAGGMIASPNALEEVSAQANQGMSKMPSDMSGMSSDKGKSMEGMSKKSSDISGMSGDKGNMKKGMGQMPSAMGMSAMTGKEVIITEPSGTGPYKLVEHVEGQYWSMEAIDDYWQGPVGIKRIKYLVIPDAHSRIMAMESGQIHITGISPLSRIGAGDIALVETNKDLVIKHEPSFGVTPVAFNTVKGIFTDARVREAFVKAIKLEDINKVLTPVGSTLDTPVAKASPFYLPELAETRKYDPERAQELLAEAGWVKSNDGIWKKGDESLQVTLMYSQTNPEMVQIASILQQQLRAIGVDLKISQIEGGAIFRSLAKKDYDLIAAPGIGACSLNFNDYYSKSRYSVAADKELDSMIKKYDGAANFDEQRSVGKKIQGKILADNLVLLYFNKNKTVAHTAKLENFKPALEEECNFTRHIWQAKLSQ